MDYQQIPATKKEACVGEAQPNGVCSPWANVYV